MKNLMDTLNESLNNVKVFIRKNTKELREIASNRHHRHGDYLWEREFDTLLVVDGNKFYCMDDENNNDKKLISKGFIDCGVDEEKFKSLVTA